MTAGVALVLRLGAGLSRLVSLVALAASPAFAEKLPAPEAFEKAGLAATTLTVVEPHESAPGHRVEVAYRAFPAAPALAVALGPDWASPGGEVEFRALDGYVSRIPVARLIGGKAWLAYARADGRPFVADNLGQNQTAVPLGPWYLIWDNRDDPALIAQGGRDWPYQTAEASVATGSDAALRPPGFDPSLEPGLAAAKANCLLCHKVNGWGGDKAAADLAALTRSLQKPDFMAWTLNPASADAKTTMPALLPEAPAPERSATAEAIYAYLSQVPLAK